MAPEFPRSLLADRPEIPPAEDCVLGYLLEKQAHERPEQTFATFEDGESWNYRELLDRVAKTATALRGMGVGTGDHVLVFLPNGADCLRLWFAINWLGAVYVPINNALKGNTLANVINTSGGQLLFTDMPGSARLKTVDLQSIEKLVILSASTDPLTVQSEPTPFNRATEPSTTQSILFTSGTTGPSKGVLSSYCHLATAAAAAFEGKLHPDIRYLVQLPLFHAGATIGVYAMLMCGGSIAIAPSFSTTNFWNTVNQTGATCATILGSMATQLLAHTTQPTSTGLNWCFLVPLTRDNLSFSSRFSVDVYTQHNMTEVSCPITSEVNPQFENYCGTARPGVQLRLVDEHDRDVPIGTVGELCVKNDREWSMSHGYYNDPDATNRAWRDGWFHTGDALRANNKGQFFFVDRMKDAIRRRGENISSFEVEAEIIAHPDILEVAVVGVPSDGGEEEVMAVYVLRQNTTIDPRQLTEFLRPKMAHFMVPRYFVATESLPKTPTGKIEKHALDGATLLSKAWDREANGIFLKRSSED